MTPARFSLETDFDWSALWAAMEAEREARGLTTNGMLNDLAWFGLGVLNAIRDGKGTTCQHVMGPLRWLDRTPESFTPGCVDSPETALPNFGDRALRWSIPLLFAAVDDERTARELSWDDAAEELAMGVKGLRTFNRLKYGMPMSMAMRLSRWTGRPAASFLYAAEQHKIYTPPLTRP
jgi:hypothetical protein